MPGLAPDGQLAAENTVLRTENAALRAGHEELEGIVGGVDRAGGGASLTTPTTPRRSSPSAGATKSSVTFIMSASVRSAASRAMNWRLRKTSTMGTSTAAQAPRLHRHTSFP